LAATILPANSGWPASIPESITATRTGGSSGSSAQKSKARFWVAYHWRAWSGSLGANADLERSAAAVETAASASTSAARPIRITSP
jgi:hypothetical protein